MYDYFKQIKVIDLSRMLPGPYCTMLLGDLGMEIIKVEDIEHEDITRDRAKPIFNMLNRNKKSIAINLKQEDGREVLRQLVAEADVFLEGFRPGVLDRLGFGYEQVKEINPQIVYCSLSGFGQTGPYKNRAGHDLNFLALAGMVGIPSQMEMPTTRPATRIADLAGGMMAAFSILAALMESKHSKLGQYVDVSMTDVLATWVGLFLPALIKNEKALSGSESPLVMPGNDMYEAKDRKWLALGLNEDKFWTKFLHCLQDEFPALSLKQWRSPVERMRRKIELHHLIKGIILSKPFSYWEKIFGSSDIPWTPVNSAIDVIRDPHLKARQIFYHCFNPETGEKELHVRFPTLFSTPLPTCQSAAPALGEHTEEILQSLNYQSSIVDHLRQIKAVGIRK
ncbi:CaiB/BaiF CoA transferase family protein [Bacillus bingmayongensis]|uniref:CaiB/BaiF CoA transferase family protein n=1 Tax=Bacillus bingmayongensis TaxID=1150157 RepID=UPI0002E22F1A|nr:CoA transferase [Bacillus bingmayongensis]MBY0597491.1 CoA transferase [Bacillus bingmayongensis]